MTKFMRPGTLLCFSPPIMIATIAIELGLAAWVGLRYVTSTTRRLLVAILICLAAFQLAEYHVCSSLSSPIPWSRLGFIFITLLPPLGLHVIWRLRHETTAGLLRASYVSAGLFILGFSFLPTQLNQSVCTGNYVIFHLGQPLTAIYTFYYLGIVLIGLAYALNPRKASSSSKRKALGWMATSYLAFMIPTFVVNILLPATRLGIPSIMCGFAVLLAVIIGLRVAPLAKR